MNLRTRIYRSGLVAILAGSILLPACGGGSSGGGGTGPLPPPPTANSVGVAVNAGPSNKAVNFAYVTVKVCNPGSTTTCATIPNVQVDTGSAGLRVLANAPGVSSLSLTPVTGGGSSVYECVQYADGTYLWGQVMQGTVSMAGEVGSHVPLQVISNTGAPSNVTASCNPLGGAAITTAVGLQANGILGIGASKADCGSACSGSTVLPYYWLCSSNGSTCSNPASVPTATQVSNPIPFFTSDNNGVVLSMAAVDAGGATSGSGTLMFGVGTQTDNALSSSAKVYALSANLLGAQLYNSILSTYNGTTYTTFIDSSQSTNVFLDAAKVAAASAGSSVAYCTGSSYLYCLTSGGGSPLSLPFTLKDSLGTSSTPNLLIGNGTTLVNSSVTKGGSNVAFNDLTGGYTLGSNDYVDLGLPFLYGKTLYIGISGQTPPTGVTNAPLGYWAF